MPLKNGYSKEAISSNIKEMMGAGHSRSQAIAASLSTARKAKKMAVGGSVEPEIMEGERAANNSESRGPEGSDARDAFDQGGPENVMPTVASGAEPRDEMTDEMRKIIAKRKSRYNLGE